MKGNKYRVYKWIVYVLVWALVLLFPVVNALLDTAGGKDFSWSGILRVWCSIAPFAVLFLLHDLLLVPRLFLMRRIGWYVLSVVAAMALFLFSQRILLEKDRMHTYSGWEKPAIPADRFAPMPPDFRPEPPTKKLPPPQDRISHPKTGGERLPLPLIMDTVIALLMLGFNLAVVLLFRYQQEKVRNQELENSHLQHELDYLKAQINPHFFMNMLNNIHGMVEVDPPRAQEMILELSKLMRYVLYEGANARTFFSNEVNFIDNYIALMRQRYSDRKVRIAVSLPESAPADLQIPPLLTIVFIENAFKHGISYRRPSFVEVDLSVGDGEILFRCRNSNARRNNEDTPRGVGLENVRKRLDLLYGPTYTLQIDDEPETYGVTLKIPCV